MRYWKIHREIAGAYRGLVDKMISMSTMMQVVGVLDFSSCNYRWNSIMQTYTSCPTPLSLVTSD